MNYADSEWIPSNFPSYTSAGIISLYGTSNLPIYPINESSTVLIALASGKGRLQLDDESYELSEGSVLLLPVNSGAALTTNRQHPLHAYLLKLNPSESMMKGSSHTDGSWRSSEILSRQEISFLAYEPGIVAKLEDMYVHRVPAHETRHIQNQILLHEILLRLLEIQQKKESENDQPSMELSMAYMEQHYGDKLSREQLAAIAGVSPSHYSTLFKQLTGLSPSEYLTRLRVHRAIELLMGGTGTLREIALKVGYKDEFYLSRRFKQQTGASPSHYRHGHGAVPRVAVWLIPYASHLLLLGVEPVVTIAENSEYVDTSEHERPEAMRFLDINSSLDQIKSVLTDQKIELIIAANQHLQHMGLHSGQLRSIAPVLEVSWMEVGWKEHLRLIAHAVGREERAEQWLSVFEEEEMEAREKVNRHEIAHEVITILVIRPGRMLVYGGRNVGYVMYQSLGLQPPARIKAEMEMHRDQFHSVSITLTELVDYGGDRILVVVYPDEKGSTAHAEPILQSDVWMGLSAVQRGLVYFLDRDDWIPYNPVSIRLQLQRAVALFAPDS
ncbi:helix-turn-helix domain-containing protein [Paenibacillus paeoniae]|uniref:AraC family transcriptional regulator n=1 Tax=Paenibacillus paeoniae TaxID=2292705 RepID=A0A371PIZ8_9BACL|nr:AraC family transcriptional regulator [Paenibacillus paeoniae]REK75609.1 AraC family transcriptional regulator [Paenibacillus paeoniae]